VSLRGLDRLRGYGARVDNFNGGGGIVEEGLGEVNAKTRAVATASAKVLNSATGVTIDDLRVSVAQQGISELRLFLRASYSRCVSGKVKHVVKHLKEKACSWRTLTISFYINSTSLPSKLAI
jgi:hypothetical protein